MILKASVDAEEIRDIRQLEFNATEIEVLFYHGFANFVTKWNPVLFGLHWGHYELNKLLTKSIAFKVQSQTSDQYREEGGPELQEHWQRTQLPVRELDV